jgi:hypothetical protein
MGANWIAYFALLIWPVVALYLYSRLPVGQATLWTILGGYLLLPDTLAIKVEMIPAFDKSTMPNLAALIGCTLYARRLPKIFHAFGLAEVLILLVLIGPFITSMLNSDEIRIGETVLPGVGFYDAGSSAIYKFIFMLPFFLGRQFVRSAENNAEILRIMVIAGLAYSLPMLFEVRMSPELSTWIYGYQGIGVPAAFRDGGSRPVVFLTNGLLVAFFAMTTTVAAAALWRTQTRIRRWPPSGITAYLTFVLVLCKTMGALVYGAALMPLVRWASPRLQLRVACVLVTIALAYPMLRSVDVFPTNAFLQAARVVSVDRADSLNTRFVNENLLLERASERPWFGWGRYGRGRVYNGWLGSDSTLSDGYWIVLLGATGIVGFIGTFGLLSLPVFRAVNALKFTQTMREALCLAALALIVAISVVDLLPNASISPWTWLLVGALLGRAEMLRAASSRKVHFYDKNLLVDRPAS